MIPTNMHVKIAKDLKHFGGKLQCMECGYEQPLGHIASKLKSGWPKHCGYTMRWWTERQLKGELPK